LNKFFHDLVEILSWSRKFMSMMKGKDDGDVNKRKSITSKGDVEAKDKRQDKGKIKVMYEMQM
jgi:hypothetical protein